MELEALIAVLKSCRAPFSTERALQDSIEKLLLEKGVAYKREAVIGPRDRIDFLCGRIGIEVKVSGARMQVMRQLKRYFLSTELDAVVLVTVCARHLMPLTLSGKPVAVVRLVCL